MEKFNYPKTMVAFSEEQGFQPCALRRFIYKHYLIFSAIFLICNHIRSMQYAEASGIEAAIVGGMIVPPNALLNIPAFVRKIMNIALTITLVIYLYPF